MYTDTIAEISVPAHVIRYFSVRQSISFDESSAIFDALVSYLGSDREADVPSQIIDEAWHVFLLHSREYQTFCWEKFGHFVHHIPAALAEHPDAGPCSRCSSSCSSRVSHSAI
jgi:hypothetical protein